MTAVPTPSRSRALLVSATAWVVLVACETLAQVALKAAGPSIEAATGLVQWGLAVATSGWAWIGILGYLGSFAAWMVILDKVPLSLGFPLTSVVYVTVTLASLFVFGEEITPLRWAGIALIIGGILVLGTEDDDPCAP